MEKKRIRVGITHGDVNGVNYEVLIKVLADNAMLEFCIPIIYGSSKAAAYYRKMFDIQGFSINAIANVSEVNPKRINLINCCGDDLKVKEGTASIDAVKAAVSALDMAIDDYENGDLDALVTLPINRKNIDTAQFNFLGHCEYLEDKLARKGESVSIMVNDTLKVALLSGHTSFDNVKSYITESNIIEKIKILNIVMKEDFGIDKPRIAVLGLNPHAGDNGLLGNEEEEIIKPALDKLNDKGFICVGPLAADTFFGEERYKHYDVVLAMYHDQGMIPFKTLSMNDGVDFTANLPIIRTAPIHGTEYDIAGKNEASEISLRNAIFLARDVCFNREQYAEINANPLIVESLDSKDRHER